MSDCDYSKPEYHEGDVRRILQATFSDGKSQEFVAHYQAYTRRIHHSSKNSPIDEHCISEYRGEFHCTINQTVGAFHVDRNVFAITTSSRFRDMHHHCGEVCSQLTKYIQNVSAAVKREFQNAISKDMLSTASLLFSAFPNLQSVLFVDSNALFTRDDVVGDTVTGDGNHEVSDMTVIMC